MLVSRRQTLGFLGASAVTPALLGQGVAPKNLITPETKQAIQRGLAYLASRQTEDGGFGNGGNSRDVAIAGLAGMAFMSVGNMPGRGRYGLQVNRCIEYIVDSARENGFLVAAGSNMHGPMYGHGFATLFLAEAYGMSQQTDVRPVLAEAVKLIVNSQNKEGGWRYAPNGTDADISVTICQVMALRAAKDAGIHVPNETIDRCVEYVKRSQNPDGGFMYMLSAGGPSAFPRSAAGVVALYSAGIYKGNEVNSGIEYLLKQ